MKKGSSLEMNSGEKIVRLFKNGGTTFSLILVYIVICIVFSILSPYFFAVNNFLNIGVYASIIGVMAAGSTIAMLLGAIDISQYSVATTANVIGVLLMTAGYPLPVIIVTIIAVGALFGFINGFLTAYCQIPAIIVTLGTMQVFRAIGYIISSGSTMTFSNAAFSVFGKGYAFGVIPVSIIIVVVAMLIAHYILNSTSYGRRVYAVGGNEKASYLSGINTKATKLIALVICGVASSIGGIIIASQLSAVIPSTGVGSEMGILAAIILGGMSLTGGRGGIPGTVMGVLILATIQNGLTLLSTPSFYVMLVNGIILILAVFLDVIRSGVMKKQ